MKNQEFEVIKILVLRGQLHEPLTSDFVVLTVTNYGNIYTGNEAIAFSQATGSSRR